MAVELSTEDVTEKESRARAEFDREVVADQLQRVYEYVLNDRRPEAVGATEKLAERLDVSVERPARFPE